MKTTKEKQPTTNNQQPKTNNQRPTTKDQRPNPNDPTPTTQPPLHICFITGEYPRPGVSQGGIGSVVQTIGRALVEKGHRVSVVGFTKDVVVEESSEDRGVRIHRLPASQWPALRFLHNARLLNAKLREIHAGHPIDILEGSELSFAFIPRRFPVKKVIRMHGGHHFFAVTLGKKPAPWRSFQERRSFAKADALVAVSRFVGEKTAELLKLDQPFTTIYNIVDTAKFYPADPTKVISRKLLFVGTLTEKKGIRQLIQAMPKILDAFPDATLEVVGRDWRDPETGGSYAAYLRSLIRPEISRAVTLTGALPHDEIPGRLESAEICVYPSHMEAQGLVVVEAMAMEKLVIFSNKGPGPEMIRERETGLLCDPLDPEDIAAKIIWCLQNREKSQEMGKMARQEVLKRFNPKIIIEENIDFYYSVMEGRGK